MNQSLPSLHKASKDHLDQEELRALCFKLGIEYDDLRGEGRSGQAQELLRLVQRQNQIDHLLDTLCQAHPHVDWKKASQGSAAAPNIPRALTPYAPPKPFIGARRLYQTSLKMAEEQEQKRLIAYNLGDLGRLAAEEQEQAEKFYRQALNMQQEMGAVVEASEWIFHLGLLYEEQGRLDEALPLLEQAVKVAERAGRYEAQRWRTALERVRGAIVVSLCPPPPIGKEHAQITNNPHPHPTLRLRRRRASHPYPCASHPHPRAHRRTNPKSRHRTHRQGRIPTGRGRQTVGQEQPGRAAVVRQRGRVRPRVLVGAGLRDAGPRPRNGMRVGNTLA